MASGQVAVSVERAVHDGIAALAQQVYDTYGVKLNMANITWWDVGTVGEPKVIVAAVQIDSTTDKH